MTYDKPDFPTAPATVHRPVKVVEHPTFRRWRSQAARRRENASAVGLASFSGGRLVGDCNPTSSILLAS